MLGREGWGCRMYSLMFKKDEPVRLQCGRFVISNRVCHKNKFFEFLAPISVCHGDRYQKATQKVSGHNMTISESASHFSK